MVTVLGYQPEDLNPFDFSVQTVNRPDGKDYRAIMYNNGVDPERIEAMKADNGEWVRGILLFRRRSLSGITKIGRCGDRCFQTTSR